MNYWMRRLRAALPWLLAGVLSSGAVLLARLPAAWIAPQFARVTQGHVNLVDPEGSLWHGSATLMLAAGRDASGATLLPGRIVWRTAFWPLFIARVRMEMLQTEAMPDAVTVEASLRGANVSAGMITVPASLLAGLGAPFNTLDLSTQKGPLMLNGHGSFSRASASFQGTASAAPDQRDNLAGLLNLLGRPVSPGTVALTFMR